MKRKTVTFSDEALAIIDDVRASRRPIPDFTQVVNEIVLAWHYSVSECVSVSE